MRGGLRRGRQGGPGDLFKIISIRQRKIVLMQKRNNFHNNFHLKLQFPRDSKDMGVVGGREETEGVYK